MQHRTRAVTISWAVLLALAVVIGDAKPAQADEYPSSVVGTDFDFIRADDPSTFQCLEFKAKGTREMPDKTGPTELFQEAFIFVAYFTDGTSVDIAIDIDFETRETARKEALRYAPRLGRLPTSLRRGVERLVVHQSDKNAAAFSDEGLIVVYSDNATSRISTHDLEETLFHESVHAAWDKQHATSNAWRDAQSADGAFITRYARREPVGEDLAESALFAYTLLHHPGRIPEPHAAKITRTIPARIAFVKALVPPGEPIFYPVGPNYACDGSGKTFTVIAAEPRGCDVDITRVGTLSDILSNALMHGLNQKEPRVAAFLARAQEESASADELLEATAAEFGFERATLDAQVQAFLHCNCDHGELPAPSADPAGPQRAKEAESPYAVRSPRREPEGSEPLLPVLYLIAGLLLALLVVNAITLVVLLKQRSKPRPPAP